MIHTRVLLLGNHPEVTGAAAEGRDVNDEPAGSLEASSAGSEPPDAGPQHNGEYTPVLM